MPLPKEHSYTIEDIYALPEGERAELIDGQLYNMAPPSYMHQRLVMELSGTIREHIRNNHGDCQVLPAPLAVRLNADDKTYVEPVYLFCVIRLKYQKEALKVLRISLLKSFHPAPKSVTTALSFSNTAMPACVSTGS